MTILKQCAKKPWPLAHQSVIIEDLKREFVTDYIFQAVKAHAVYEDRYLLGTALASRSLRRSRLRPPLNTGPIMSLTAQPARVMTRCGLSWHTMLSSQT